MAKTAHTLYWISGNLHGSAIWVFPLELGVPLISVIDNGLELTLKALKMVKHHFGSLIREIKLGTSPRPMEVELFEAEEGVRAETPSPCTG